ncbi:M64 family metallopeptidase [Nocardiopsis gilva]|uniref:M64 family metallopeptidase n=1 Tax=Nocardiopsis gilva TaxID=280236 RepID=UPI001E32085F|nr:M64 family metallopeptidase [Nocardiopsis gilva]
MTACLATLPLAGFALPLVGAAPATADAIEAAEVVPIQVTGDPDKRFNLVILGDGYTEEEMPLFREQVKEHLAVQWSIEPFRSYRDYFNVYAVETPSPESGVDCDPDLAAGDRDTVLGMGFYGGCDPDGLQRLLTVEDELANAAADLVPGVAAENRQILALANSETYGGAGGTHATASAGNALSALITPHELGHSLGKLQDEYPYYRRDSSLGRWDDGEPDSAHLTVMTPEEMEERRAKWWRWLGEESASGGVIGAAGSAGHEGGLYHSEGVWRPSRHSMMKTLGYYLDQVSREVMVRRISGQRDRGKLPVSSTPEGEVGPDDTVWVEAPHPAFHDLTFTWTVDGEELPEAEGQRALDLSDLELDAGTEVAVRVQDPTPFVRDPEVRASPALTQTRTWTVGAPLPADDAPVRFTAARDTERPVAADEVVYAETTHPSDRVPEVVWELDGKKVATSADGRTLDLGEFGLEGGAHTLTATADPGAGDPDTLSWTVDATGPTAERELSSPAAPVRGAKGEHGIHLGSLTLGLDPRDDRDGPVVAEFRVDGDGWHHYYGWPTDPDAPFLLTPRGTSVDKLVYGSLGSGGLSMAVFEVDDHEPGWGTHTVEHRAIDAAGNIGAADSFRATVVPGDAPECTETVTGVHRGGLDVDEGTVCLEGATVVGAVTVGPGASVIAQGTSVVGGLTADGAATVRLADTEVARAVRITGTTGETSLLGSDLIGPVTLRGNTQTPAADWTASQPKGGADDGYGVIVAGNRLRGGIDCTGNSPSVTDFDAPNTVTGPATGQCADL